MRLLVFGPGMIGTLYAARLAHAGHEVTVLGRGARAARIRSDGLSIRDPRGRRIDVRVGVAERPPSDRAFDWVLATIRGDQVDAALPMLNAIEAPSVLVMANHAEGFDGWSAGLGEERLAIGFPGSSGVFADDGVLDFRIAPSAFQPTMVGELDGSRSARLTALRDALVGAGFPTRIQADMRAWMRSHVAWISVFAMLSNACGHEAARLVSDPALRRLAIDAMRESFGAVRASGAPITPRGLIALERAPRGLFSVVLSGLARHPAIRATLEHDGAGRRAEAAHMARQMIELAAEHGHAMPRYEALARHVLD